MSRDFSDDRQKKAWYDAAKNICDSGWRQGSIFIPENSLEIPIEFDKDDERLIVTTHSCAVVSKRFGVDPKVEVMVCRKLQTFKPKSYEATGKNQRILHIEIFSEELEFAAIECNINRRFFFDRMELLNLSVEKNLCKKDEKKLAIWLARSYNRIALPDELVIALRKEFMPKLKKCIEKKINGIPIHSEIENIYISFSENKESETSYDLQLIFLCKNQDVSDGLDCVLNENLLDDFHKGNNAINLSFLECKPKDQIFISDLDPYDRFSDWDSLTDLGDVLIEGI